MSSVYIGLASNIGLPPAAVTATIPGDGDARTAASVNAALQKLTDYIAYLESQAGFGIVTFGATSTPATTVLNYLIPGGASGPSTITFSNKLAIPMGMNAATGFFRLAKIYVTCDTGPTGAGIDFGVSGSPSLVTLAAGATSAVAACNVTFGPNFPMFLSATGKIGIATGATNVMVSLTYTIQ